MKIGIACDHAGYELKSSILNELKNSSYQFIDYGCDNSSDSVDYPDFANKLCNKIGGEINYGILICGSGVGISIAANRFNKIRAALCHDSQIAQLSRKHNDANVLCLGSRIIDQKTAIDCIKTFLSTDFEKGRHIKRVEKLTK